MHPEGPLDYSFFFGLRLTDTFTEMRARGWTKLPGVTEAKHERVFREAGAVTLHTDLDPTRHHLVNRESLSWMKRSAQAWERVHKSGIRNLLQSLGMGGEGAPA